ncbi:MAG: hypothetical protein BMS9Abin10_1024 [Gammaproteobacteria bacterium]|nr:MAG: hypothetical protein BMS9Abin10_1024 [Gammaproteobacteria bacterium]
MTVDRSIRKTPRQGVLCTYMGLFVLMLKTDCPL